MGKTFPCRIRYSPHFQSVARRMNTGNIWEQYNNASLEQMRREMSDRMDSGRYTLDENWEYLLGYYKLLSPWYHEVISSGIQSAQDISNHIEEFINSEITVVIPHGTCRVGTEHSYKLEQHYPVDYGKVLLYHPHKGMIESKNDILVGKVYIFRLEKIGEYWASTSVPRRQHNGVIAKLSAETGHQLPYRDQAIRMGETEIRRMMAMANPTVIAALLRISNNSELSDLAVKEILTAENPSAIKEITDYNNIDNYPSVPIQRIMHQMSCYGLEYQYHDSNETTFETADKLLVDIVNHTTSGEDD